jgi:hypothetical protein
VPEPALGSLAAFDFAVPAAMGSISDECSFGREASAEAGYVVAGGEELRASQNEVAFAGTLGRWPEAVSEFEFGLEEAGLQPVQAFAPGMPSAEELSALSAAAAYRQAVVPAGP